MKNLNNYFLLKYQLFILTVSIFLWIYLFGFEHIKLTNTDWLTSGDLPIYQIGWNYFRDDIWRFPIGSNPNYGIYYQGSVGLVAGDGFEPPTFRL